MTWTYTDDPVGIPRDAVRALIGDTDTTDQQLTDEVIAYFLSLQSEPTAAAALAARGIAAFYARKSDTTVDVLSFKNSQKSKAYLNLALSLERQAAMLGINVGAPQVLGVSQSAMLAANQDCDRFPPRFSMGMTDFSRPQDSAAGTGLANPGFGGVDIG